MAKIETVLVCRDQNCPSCGWPETYTRVETRGDRGRLVPMGVGCRKCGYYQPYHDLLVTVHGIGRIHWDWVLQQLTFTPAGKQTPTDYRNLTTNHNNRADALRTAGRWITTLQQEQT